MAGEQNAKGVDRGCVFPRFQRETFTTSREVFPPVDRCTVPKRHLFPRCKRERLSDSCGAVPRGSLWGIPMLVLEVPAWRQGRADGGADRCLILQEGIVPLWFIQPRVSTRLPAPPGCFRLVPSGWMGGRCGARRETRVDASLCNRFRNVLQLCRSFVAGHRTAVGKRFMCAYASASSTFWWALLWAGNLLRNLCAWQTSATTDR